MVKKLFLDPTRRMLLADLFWELDRCAAFPTLEDLIDALQRMRLMKYVKSETEGGASVCLLRQRSVLIDRPMQDSHSAVECAGLSWRCKRRGQESRVYVELPIRAADTLGRLQVMLVGTELRQPRLTNAASCCKRDRVP